MATRPEHPSWRLIDVLQEATAYLETKSIEQPRLNAERLLAHILKISRVSLYLQFEKPLKTDEKEAYKILLRRRASHEPLQYILGETEFMSLPFRVTCDVLIPRPETETLVEKTLEIVKTNFKNKSPLNILDIGTGTGCIAISLAKNLMPAQIIAMDNNEAALKLALKNAEFNKVDNQINFIKLDVMDQTNSIGDSTFDLIVSNPPYIRKADLAGLAPEIREFEPITALNGGPDGLNFYRRFQELLPQWINTPGAVLLEIGADQADDVINIFKTGTWKSIEIFKDLAGLDRMIVLTN